MKQDDHGSPQVEVLPITKLLMIQVTENQNQSQHKGSFINLCHSKFRYRIQIDLSSDSTSQSVTFLPVTFLNYIFFFCTSSSLGRTSLHSGRGLSASSHIYTSHSASSIKKETPLLFPLLGPMLFMLLSVNNHCDKEDSMLSPVKSASQTHHRRERKQFFKLDKYIPTAS